MIIMILSTMKIQTQKLQEQAQQNGRCY